MKKQQKKVVKDRKGIWFHLFKYFASIFSIWLFVSAAYIFFPKAVPQVSCANSISCIKNLSSTVENNTPGVFMGKKVTVPSVSLMPSEQLAVLGETTHAGSKHVYVDLAKQTLYAFQGNTLKYQFLISSGKWKPTPTGDFHFWIKLRSTRMTGGEGADFYDLPNVEFTMFFYNDQYPKSMGYSTHTAYWHNNFGHPMSHGCVNMRRADAETLYNWADPPTTGFTTYATTQNPGTEITIFGQPPAS